MRGDIYELFGVAAPVQRGLRVLRNARISYAELAHNAFCRAEIGFFQSLFSVHGFYLVHVRDKRAVYQIYFTHCRAVKPLNGNADCVAGQPVDLFKLRNRAYGIHIFEFYFGKLRVLLRAQKHTRTVFSRVFYRGQRNKPAHVKAYCHVRERHPAP